MSDVALETLISDINDAWCLALKARGYTETEVQELRTTVEDAVANNVE